MIDTRWQPTASQTTLKQRAKLLAQIRQFFAERDVLEVETPILCQSTVSDPHIHSLSSTCRIPGQAEPQRFYLQTSPEFAMKRLLAAGSGSIYQICKVFRDAEAGTRHNPEFTMLEWYRIDFDHHALMDEIDDLLAWVLHSPRAERLSYQAAFMRYLHINPFTATLNDLQTIASDRHLDITHVQSDDRDTWLNLLLSHFIEQHLGKGQPTFLYDYPPSQAALARVRPEQPPVAERFEVYIDGIELANGFHECPSAAELKQRFLEDLAWREKHHLPTFPLPEYLFAAHEHGLPDCAGVALGIDRLIMLATKSSCLADVLTFPIERA